MPSHVVPNRRKAVRPGLGWAGLAFGAAISALTVPAIASETEPTTRGRFDVVTSATKLERHVFDEANAVWTRFGLCAASAADSREPVVFVGIPENDPRVDRAIRQLINSTVERVVGGARGAVLYDHLGHLATFLDNDAKGRQILQDSEATFAQRPFLVTAETTKRQVRDDEDLLHLKLRFVDRRADCGNTEEQIIRIDLSRLEVREEIDTATPDGFELTGFYRRGLEQFSALLTDEAKPVPAVSLNIALNAAGNCYLGTAARQQFQSHYNQLGRQLNRLINRQVLPGLRASAIGATQEPRPEEPEIRVTLAPTPFSERIVTANMELVQDGILLDSFAHLVLVPPGTMDGCTTVASGATVTAARTTPEGVPSAAGTPGRATPGTATPGSTTTGAATTNAADPARNCVICGDMAALNHVRDASGRIIGLTPAASTGITQVDAPGSGSACRPPRGERCGVPSVHVVNGLCADGDGARPRGALPGARWG